MAGCREVYQTREFSWQSLSYSRPCCFLPAADLRSFAPIRTPLCTSEILLSAGSLPQAKSSSKCIGVIAGATTRRQLFQFFHVASAKHHVVRFDGSNEALHHVSDITSPFFLPVFFEAANSNVVLKSGLLVRQVAQLHRLDDPIDDQRGAETGPQSQKKHLAAFVTSQRLHGRIVHDLDGAFECGLEVETGPCFSQIPRF